MYTWHALTREEVIDALHTHRRRGLSEKEAAERLTRYGPNRLEGKKRDSGLKRLLGAPDQQQPQRLGGKPAVIRAQSLLSPNGEHRDIGRNGRAVVLADVI